MRALPHLAEPDPPPFDGLPSPAANPALAALPRHRPWLLALLRLRYGADLAEDLVQETFLRAAARGAADPVRHPRAWLLRIALNAARDHHRRRSVRPPPAAAQDRQAVDDLATLPGQAEALLLKQVILALPQPLRDTFLLSRFGGLTYDEIGRRLGVSAKTVEWRMSKALAICAALLQD